MKIFLQSIHYLNGLNKRLKIQEQIGCKCNHCNNENGVFIRYISLKEEQVTCCEHSSDVTTVSVIE